MSATLIYLLKGIISYGINTQLDGGDFGTVYRLEDGLHRFVLLTIFIANICLIILLSLSPSSVSYINYLVHLTCQTCLELLYMLRIKIHENV